MTSPLIIVRGSAGTDAVPLTPRFDVELAAESRRYDCVAAVIALPPPTFDNMPSTNSSNDIPAVVVVGLRTALAAGGTGTEVADDGGDGVRTPLVVPLVHALSDDTGGVMRPFSCAWYWCRTRLSGEYG